jgi:beta-glucanase (GH16 family)
MVGLISVLAAKAQYSRIDFNTPTLHTFTSFGGASFSVVSDPVFTGNHMGQLQNAGAVWEGAYLDLPSSAHLDSNQIIQIDIHNPNGATREVIAKLEGGFTADLEVTHTLSGQGWSTLHFDFSQARITGTNTIISASGPYQRIVLFIDGPLASAGTFGIDNILYPNYSSVYSLDIEYTDLVWSDEFNGNGQVDTSQWFQEVVPPNAWGWHNGEFQHYTNRLDNSYQSNGKLHIVAKRETYTDYGLTLNYTSARLNSKFSFQYGRVDARAKMPRGVGTWPAIWMLGLSHGNHWNSSTLPWPDCGEIDIMEHWGIDSGRVQSALHTLSSHGSTVNKGPFPLPSVSDSFHVYSVNWSPNQISFLVDGELFYVYDPDIKNAATWPFDDPQFLILNVAMGSTWHTIDPNFTESQMEVDYIRVYQNTSMGINELHPSQVRIYPQPASDYIQIDGQNVEQFVLYDYLGRECLNTHPSSLGKSVIAVDHLPRGVYVWQAVTSNTIERGQLLISR